MEEMSMLNVNCRELILKSEGRRFILAVELGLEVTGQWLLLSCFRELKS